MLKHLNPYDYMVKKETFMSFVSIGFYLIIHTDEEY